MDQDIKAQIAQKAIESLEGPPDEDGTATVKEDPSPEDAPEPAEDGVTVPGEEPEEDDPEAEDDPESPDEEDDEDPEEPEDDPEEDPEDEPEEEPKGKGSRAQKRIVQLHDRAIRAETEAEVLRKMIEGQKGTPSQKEEAKKELEQEFKPEEIEAAKKLLRTIGVDPDNVAQMQGTLKKMQDDALVKADQVELEAAVAGAKGTVTKEEVQKAVHKWANSKDPKLQARAALAYTDIVRLLGGKKLAQKTVDDTIKAKKKAAPKIPAGGSKVEAEKADPFAWDPADRRGSLDALQDLASSSMEE